MSGHLEFLSFPEESISELEESGLHRLTAFQSQSWAEVLAELDGGRAFRAPQSEGGAESHPWYLVEYRWRFFFRRLAAMPYSLYGPPPMSSGKSPQGAQLLRKLLRGRTILLTYAEHPLQPPLKLEPPEGFVVSSREVSAEIVSLDGGEDQVWKNLSHDHRNMIRRAEREGITVRTVEGFEDIEKFYAVYQVTAQHWEGGRRPMLLSFFKKLLQRELGVELVCAEWKGKVVAGAVFVGDVASTLYWFSALDRKFSKYFPMYRIIWEQMRKAIAKGQQWFNLGASDDHAGVRQFKLSWGAASRPYKIHTYRREPLCSFLDKLARPAGAVRATVAGLLRGVGRPTQLRLLGTDRCGWF